jgi:hypothetical protein
LIARGREVWGLGFGQLDATVAAAELHGSPSDWVGFGRNWAHQARSAHGKASIRADWHGCPGGDKKEASSPLRSGHAKHHNPGQIPK